MHLQIHPKDNIWVALRNLSKGQTFQEGEISVTLTMDIEAKHKFTITPIAKNKEIILLENNVTQIKKIAAEHEERGNFYKSEVDKQKRLKNIAIGGGILSVILSILFL
jgi:hypothetical protein